MQSIQKGDAFARRSDYAMAIDYEKEPPLFRISKDHYAATWLEHPDAPKVIPPEVIQKRYKIYNDLQKGIEPEGNLFDIEPSFENKELTHEESVEEREFKRAQVILNSEEESIHE